MSMFTQSSLHPPRRLLALRFTPQLWVLIILAVTLSSPASAQSPCKDAISLPEDRSVYGHIPDQGPAVYQIEAPEPGWLTVEAHGIEPASGSPRIVVSDASCRPLPESPARRAPGHEARRVDGGTYYVSVESSGTSASSFRLFAWLAPASGDRKSILRIAATEESNGDDDDDSTPHEPIDEWDELTRWCPWTARPELLATFSCARQLQLGDGDSLTIHPLRHGESEMFVLVTNEPGTLVADLDDQSGGLTILDHRGNFVEEMISGRPSELPANRWFLRWHGATRPLHLTW